MILRIFDHFLRWIDVNWHHYVCYLSKYSSETLTDYKYWCKSSYNPLKSDFVAIYSTKNYDFAHFRSFLTQRWRQIDINWRQYVCYLSKYSSNTLTDCRNWYKPLWKPLKSGIVAIYTTKTDDFSHFRSFSTSNWRQLTSYWVLSQ